ncbi:MAG: membrane dipeptidase [Verrucomicrobiae bacterium]|nr:membrane dipeptidase [Verrucomicrobiae bacterium]
MELIFDCHLDLSMNALEWNRDLREPVARIREIESGMTDMKGRALGTTAFPEMRAGGMGICVATQIGGCMKPRGPVASWESPPQAWAMTQGQLAWYRVMEELGEMREIRDADGLRSHLETWADPEAAAEAKAPIGYIRSLEGADSIVTLDYLERAWADGLRALGPAHYGEGRYAMGHDRTGPLKPEGRELIKEMDRLGMILDVTHLCDDCFWEALDLFSGPVWASHSNCRALVPDVRQFSDEQLKALIERGSVIGAAFDAWMILPGWERGKTTPKDLGVKIDHVVDHIDHVCQLAGNAGHAGIGTDLDGGFGTEQSPMDLDTIADVATVADKLRDRGYAAADVTAIMSGNYLRFLETAWSD